LTDEVFVVPPGWPQPPDGWEPPSDWRPDPDWPPAPPGWQFWQEPPVDPRREAAVDPRREAAVDPRREAAKLRRENAVLRGEIRRLETAVEASNAELRRLLGADPMRIRAETERMLRDWDTAQIQLQTTLAQLTATQRRLDPATPAQDEWSSPG
jgi:hypothetical protein